MSGGLITKDIDIMTCNCHVRARGVSDQRLSDLCAPDPLRDVYDPERVSRGESGEYDEYACDDYVCDVHVPDPESRGVHAKFACTWRSCPWPCFRVCL